MRPRSPRRGLWRLVAATGAGILVGVSGLTACTTDPAPPPPAPPTSTTVVSPTVGKAPIVVNAEEPAQRLMPADIGDEYGQRIGSLLYRGLVRYDAKGKLVNEVAEEIADERGTLYRIKVRRGWYFGNGEPVTARSFVDAWNWAAVPAHGMLRTDAFAGIVGYAAMRGRPEPTPAPVGPTTGPGAMSTTSSTPSANPSGTPTPAAPATTPPAAPPTTDPAPSGGVPTPPPTTLRGLAVIDDLTFTVRLTQPDYTFRDRLAQLAFAPLPQAAWKDPAGFATHPVGNGPYQLSAWVPGKEVRLLPSASYAGTERARNGGLTFRFFVDPSLTYAMLLQGRLDALDDVPLTALDRYKADLGARASNQPVGIQQVLTFPVDRPEWAGADGLAVRRAISLAIDRPGLATGLFRGTRVPAGDLAAPVVGGFAKDLCGSTCTYDVEAARREYAKLVTRPKALEIAYGADGGQGPVVQALCTAITDALRLPCTARPWPSQAALDRALALHQVSTPTLTSWRMHRPELSGFLAPRFVTGSSWNTSGYAAAPAQALIVKALALPDVEARNAAFQEAERSVLADLPVIPLWYVNATVCSGTRVDAAHTDSFGEPRYTEMERP